MEGKHVVGIDVPKAQLDLAFRPSGKRLAVASASRGITRLVAMSKTDAIDAEIFGALRLSN